MRRPKRLGRRDCLGVDLLISFEHLAFLFQMEEGPPSTGAVQNCASTDHGSRADD